MEMFCWPARNINNKHVRRPPRLGPLTLGPTSEYRHRGNSGPIFYFSAI